MKPSPRICFIPDETWPDNQGHHINAHGGGILHHEGMYYWIGEHKEDGDTAEVGVHVYSSDDLYNWTDRGVALAVVDEPGHDIERGCIIERPKVIFNARTGKFVMWFHLELKGHGRQAARSGVAVADHPTGPYRFLHSLRPNPGVWPLNVTGQQKASLEEGRKLLGTSFWGSPHPDRAKMNFLSRDLPGGQMAKDMTLFLDDDGTAYHVYSSEENSTLHIARLSSDFTTHEGAWTRIFPYLWHEAPALFKHDGSYWMLSSHCTGWTPNIARLSVAESIWGPWRELGNPCSGPTPPDRLGPELTFGGQSTFVLPVHGKPSAFIAMFDTWRPEAHRHSGYVWLPICFAKGHPAIEWRDRWDLSVFARRV